jgi:hypothetical protein
MKTVMKLATIATGFALGSILGPHAAHQPAGNGLIGDENWSTHRFEAALNRGPSLFAAPSGL